MASRADELRQKILSDPNTAVIAKHLQVPLAEYVELVLKYAMNPELPVQLDIRSDEELEAMGVKVPKDAEMAQFVEEFLAADEKIEATNYRDQQKAKMEIPLDPVQSATDKPVDPALAAEISKRRK